MSSTATAAPTERAYYEDTYLDFLKGASVTSVEFSGDELRVACDKTLFYVQGGGQPSDAGVFILGDGSERAVTALSVDRESDVVWHTLAPGPGSVEVGDTVAMRIDLAKRKLHARLHSAGHLLDAAMQRIGQTAIIPTKGNHFPDSPYVEYAGAVDDANGIMDALNAELVRLIAEDAPVVVRSVPRAELVSVCGYDPSYLAASVTAVRVVTIAGNASPCAGTHVPKLADLVSVTVRKIKVSNSKGSKVTRVSYAIAASL